MQPLTSQEFVDYVGIPVAVLVCLALLIVVAQADAPVLRLRWLQLCRWWYDGGTRCPRCGDKDRKDDIAVLGMCWGCHFEKLVNQKRLSRTLCYREREPKRLLVTQDGGV